MTEMKYRIFDGSDKVVAQTNHAEDAALIVKRWGFNASVYIRRVLVRECVWVEGYPEGVLSRRSEGEWWGEPAKDADYDTAHIAATITARTRALGPVA